MGIGFNLNTAPGLGLAGIASFFTGGGMASFIGTTTWANRPSSASLGDMLLASDVGPAPGSLMMWNGTRWSSKFPQFLAGSGEQGAIHTGTLAKTALASFVVPANLLGPKGQLIVEYILSGNTSPTGQLAQVTFGGTDLQHAGPIGVNVHGARITIQNREVTNAQVGHGINADLAYVSFNTGTAPVMTAAVDTTAAVTVAINMTLGLIADTVRLETWNAYFVAP